MIDLHGSPSWFPGVRSVVYSIVSLLLLLLLLLLYLVADLAMDCRYYTIYIYNIYIYITIDDIWFSVWLSKFPKGENKRRREKKKIDEELIVESSSMSEQSTFKHI